MLGALIRQLYHDLILVGDAARDAPLRGPLYYQLRASVRAMTWFLLVSDLNAYDDDAVECARQLAVVGQRLVDGCRADGSAYPQQMQMVPVRVRGVHAPMALVPRASGRRAVVPGPFGALPIDLMVPVLYFTCGVVTINGRAIVADVQTAVRLREVSKHFNASVARFAELYLIDKVGFQAAATNPMVESSLYDADEKALALTARQIIEACSPDDYVYLGMGASPVPVLAQINRICSRAVVINMPLSNIREENFHALIQTVLGEPHARQALFAYLDQFVSLEILRGKRVLLIDFVDKGYSLRLVRLCLLEYYTLRGHKDADNLVTVFALASGDNHKKVASYEVPAHRLRALDHEDDPEGLLPDLLATFTYEVFKKRNYTLFGKVDIMSVLGGQVPDAPAPNFGAYQRLLKHLMDPATEDDEEHD